MKTAIITSERHDVHFQTGHVERPERLHAVQQLLARDPILSDLLTTAVVPATKEAACLVHTAAYYDRLVATVEAGGAQLDPDTYATPESLDVALDGLGAALQITDLVLSGDVHNGFSVMRPPGHHARPTDAMGFCLFSNIAIAAEWARQKHGLKKILIVDFDVHHGNGTQEFFYESPDVLFMSTHQWPLYPGTGALQEMGSGRGAGYTVNVPLPALTGDASYLKVFKELLRPIAFDFDPELILVSAGYDAHWMDPIGGMNLSVTGFADIVRELLSWAEALTDHKLVALLEGGYHTDALAYSVLATIQLMQHRDADIADPLGKSPHVDSDITEVFQSIKTFFASKRS